MPTLKIFRVRPMRSEDVELVLAWRNHPRIRRCMLSQHEISLQEHRAWFEAASLDPTRRLLIIEEDQIAIGFAHFCHVVAGGVSDWGFYAAPDAARGSGTQLGTAALDFAFRELKLHKVCGQALDFNHASMRLHEKLGFRKEGILREQHRIGTARHDLVCYGLLRGEWL